MFAGGMGFGHLNMLVVFPFVGRTWAFPVSQALAPAAATRHVRPPEPSTESRRSVTRPSQTSLSGRRDRRSDEGRGLRGVEGGEGLRGVKGR